jgi:hypothetical protein
MQFWLPSGKIRDDISVAVRGMRLEHTGRWGREAEGDVGIGLIGPDSVEQYVIVRTGAECIPVAEVRLVDLVKWASEADPDLVEKARQLTADLNAAREANLLQEQVILEQADDDPVPGWPLWTDYEDASNCADHLALRCMADVADGNKILPGGAPATRACRHIIDGDSITSIAASLRQHIAAVEHITS